MVPGGSVYEMMAVEPNRGLAFYTLDTKRAERPVFQRRGVECLFCHGPGNKGAAAMVVASVIPNAEGVPAYTSAFIDTIDHRTPFDRRWGGWYVTGTHGSHDAPGQRGRARSRAPAGSRSRRTPRIRRPSRAGSTSAKYLTGTSDIVALMTLEHQVGMTNRLGALGVQYRARSEPAPSTRSGIWTEPSAISWTTCCSWRQRRCRRRSRGVSTLHADVRRARAARSAGPFAPRVRPADEAVPLPGVLHDLQRAVRRAAARDPRTRVSAAARRADGQDASARYERLSAADRKAALDIIAATKPALPDYWAPAN